MSQYYKPGRSRNIYKEGNGAPFVISRSKIDLFLECPRCFYFDRRLGIGRPPGFPFNLNSAVDKLLKKEFDIHRAKQTQHPLMKTYGIEAIPFAHEDIDIWRENFKGVRFLHEPTNFEVTGAVDDVWQMPDSSIAVVDYKATSKDGEVSLDADWQIGYKRQMEVYQWLLRQKGFNVSNTGYFVYCNGQTDKEAFDGRLEFKVKIIPYTGSGEWIEKTLTDIKKCLDQAHIPAAGKECDYCAYTQALAKADTKKENQKQLKL